MITITGILTDPGWLDTHTLTIEWAPGVTETQDLAAGVYEFQLSHVYTTPGDYIVTITAADPDGGRSSQVFSIKVQLNVVDAGPDQVANEGQSVHFMGSFVDPGLLASPQAGEIILWDFGDGVTTTGVLTPTHSFGDNGNFTVTLTVTDTYGSAGHDSLQVFTANIPPSLESLPDRTVRPGQVITITGVLTDPGWLDTHTLTIEWAPGVTETQDLAAGVYEFQLSHLYPTSGDYIVTVTAADPEGGVSTQVFSIKVQLYEVFLPLTQR